MDQLINKVPEVRWSGSYAALKGNAWFDDLDWVPPFFSFLNFAIGKISRLLGEASLYSQKGIDPKR